MNKNTLRQQARRTNLDLCKHTGFDMTLSTACVKGLYAWVITVCHPQPVTSTTSPAATTTTASSATATAAAAATESTATAATESAASAPPNPPPPPPKLDLPRLLEA